MVFGLLKCTTLIMKTGKFSRNREIQMSSEEMMKTVECETL